MSLLTDARGAFVKSAASSGDGNCVEVARRPGGVRVRHSKDRSGPVLSFTDREWAAFVDGAKAGAFDLS